MLSVLTLNVQAAALPRARRLLAWLDARDDNLIILTETSNGPGTAYLLEQCRAAGLDVTHTPSPDGDRGCAIVSRLPTTARPDLLAGVTLPGRAVAVTVNTESAITVLGLYVPSSDRAPAKVAKKRAFLTSVIDGLRGLTEGQRAHLIVGGDYNVISRNHRPRYPGFLSFEYEFLDALEQLDLADAHQRLHPTTQAHSWIGRGGNGYRFDYLHTGAALTPHLASCDYLHQPRDRQLSDHAAVAATLRLTVDHRTAVSAPLAEAAALS
ncbi:exodeoxyribonuclease-3 [Micromonospora echinaurantiaca]|uniref:Exodeoxyribonuclease-3 n=1 Tax=Micromonospora echinaurantiaca TaxID=47857 RepID=A0A1C5IIC1_9ACTN|nr:endonuclease/exonuclease/phosphatase family protein [Micromonospora echinaurantiaca]SCG58110.1 exodeoxyribonuclease-3 [Micromonospora echinaurantiaca]